MRQVEYWNDYAGASWAQHADGIEGISAAIGAEALRVADPRPGERALDVGCGTGATTFALGHAVATEGRAVGVDLSAPMIEVARHRLASAGMPWVEFVEADIETAELPAGTFDLAYSRMCLMLLDNPVPGCATVAKALRPGGRLVATVFRSMADNPWLPLVLLGAAAHLDGLPPLPLPGEPGPFALAEPERVDKVLSSAGFADVRVDPLDTVATPPGSPDDVAELLIHLGPAGGAYRVSPPSRQAAARDSVRAQLGRFSGQDGLALPIGSWLITARRPG